MKNQVQIQKLVLTPNFSPTFLLPLSFIRLIFFSYSFSFFSFFSFFCLSPFLSHDHPLLPLLFFFSHFISFTLFFFTLFSFSHLPFFHFSLTHIHYHLHTHCAPHNRHVAPSPSSQSIANNLIYTNHRDLHFHGRHFHFGLRVLQDNEVKTFLLIFKVSS